MKNASEHREEFVRLQHVQYVMETMFDEAARDLDAASERAKRLANGVDPIGMSVISGSNGAKSVAEIETLATKLIEATLKRTLAELRSQRGFARDKIREALTLASFKIQEAERVPS